MKRLLYLGLEGQRAGTFALFAKRENILRKGGAGKGTTDEVPNLGY